MILDEIKQKLEEIDSHVFYGMANEDEIRENGDEWNYTVFMRKRLSIEAQHRGYSDKFTVAVIRENFIPEGLEESVINAMCSIDGMRLTSSDGEYAYIRKPNTDMVVEVFTKEFVRARKRAV